MRRTALLWILPSLALAQPESHYQSEYCSGETEVVLEDRTRVDCLSDSVAWEFDFAGKWYSAVGQALHYANMTDSEPGIVLIVEEPGDCRYVERLHSVQGQFVPELRVRVVGTQC